MRCLRLTSDKKKDEAKSETKAEPVEIDVASYRVSPDGKTIAIFAQDPETPGEKKEKDAKADAEWVDHGLHGSRMYLLDVATEKLTLTGVPMNVRGASWSADSSKLLAIAEAPNGVEELGPANSAWVVMVADPMHATKLEEIPATVGPAVWSHDGAEIVYLAQAKRDAPPGYSDMYEYDLASEGYEEFDGWVYGNGGASGADCAAGWWGAGGYGTGFGGWANAVCGGWEELGGEAAVGRGGRRL